MSNLVNTKEMFDHAYARHYAIGAFNINNMETVQGVVEAARQMRSPVILQASAITARYADLAFIVEMARAAARLAGIPVALHLDHGADVDTVERFMQAGFTSVMIDGSHLPYDENIRVTREVCKRAHAKNVTVEGELGTISGIEDDKISGSDLYTDPEQARDFVAGTGVDSLAIAIGTRHGAYKFKPGQNPELRFDLLEKTGRLIPGMPIVLHGASSVNQEDVTTINAYGGAIASAVGIPEPMLRKAAAMAVCKINVDTDVRLAMVAGMRRSMHDYPKEVDYRVFIGSGRDNAIARIKDKMVRVFGCAGKLDDD